MGTNTDVARIVLGGGNWKALSAVSLCISFGAIALLVAAAVLAALRARGGPLRRKRSTKQQLLSALLTATGVCDFVVAVVIFVSSVQRLSDSDAAAGRDANAAWCTASGALVQFFDLGSAACGVVLMAVVCWMVTSPLRKSAPAALYATAGGCAAAVVLLAAAPLAGYGRYALTGVWCETTGGPGGSASVALFYLPMLAANAAMTALFAVVLHTIHTASADASVSTSNSSITLLRRLQLFPIAFTVCMAPCYLLAAQVLIAPRAPALFLWTCQAVFRPTRGVLNTLIGMRVLGGKSSRVASSAYATTAGTGGTKIAGSAAASSAIYEQGGASAAEMGDLDNARRTVVKSSAGVAAASDGTLAAPPSRIGTTHKPRPARTRETRAASGGVAKQALESRSRGWFVAQLTATFLALIFVLVLAGALVILTNRLGGEMLDEARSAIVAQATAKTANGVSGFLDEPSRVRLAVQQAASTGTLVMAGATSTSEPEIAEYDRFVLPLVLSSPNFIAMYAGFPDRQVIKVHRETEGHICTQVRYWTVATAGATLRNDRCRPEPDLATDPLAPYYTDSSLYDDGAGGWVPPSFLTVKNYDIFAKGWYAAGNGSAGGLELGGLWDGPETQSNDPTNTERPLAFNYIFKAEWPHHAPNNGTNGGPHDYFTVHKLKFQIGALNAILRDADLGSHGNVWLADSDGQVVAARDEGDLRLAVDGVGQFRKIWELPVPELARLTQADMDTAAAGTPVSCAGDPTCSPWHTSQRVTISPLSIGGDTTWLQIVLTRDSDFLAGSIDAVRVANTISNVMLSIVVASVWRVYWIYNKI